MGYSLGLDVGGTKILGGVVDDKGVLIRDVQRPSDARDWPDMALQVVEELIARSPGPIEAAGLAVAAFVEHSGHLAFAPNLQVSARDLVAEIGKRFGLPARVDNDANAAAWAEFCFGAGAGLSDMLMLTVGTGIGGGAILDGRLYRGAHGFAAEFGHVPVSLDGPACPCGASGCLEAVASGNALGRMARERTPPGSAILTLAGGDPAAITGALVGEAALQGDQEALGLLTELASNLGVGLAGLAKAFDPQAIVVGGGVAALGDLLLQPARAQLRSRYAGQVDAPEVVIAALGNEAGVVGAAHLARLEIRI